MYSQLQVLQLLFFFFFFYWKTWQKSKDQKIFIKYKWSKVSHHCWRPVSRKRKVSLCDSCIWCLETVLFSHSAAHVVVVGHGTDQERLVIRMVFTDGVMEVQKKIGTMSAFDFIPELFLGGPHLSLLSKRIFFVLMMWLNDLTNLQSSRLHIHWNK